MSDTVDLSIRQFIGAWELLCASAPDAKRLSAPGIEYIFSGVPIPFFNTAVLTGRKIAASGLRELASDVCAWSAPSGLPYLLLVTHDALAAGVDAAAELSHSGFVPLMPLTGMIAGKVTPLPQAPGGLKLTMPDDEAGCTAIVDINSAAYGVPLDAAAPLLGTPAFWNDKIPALGVAGGRPVASTAVFPVDGFRYVALVATQPDEQRKGYAGAVMRFALQQSEKLYGDSPTVLHATDAGRPVYQRMGYARLAAHTAFIEERFLQAH